jgi:hypothetical protein
MAQAIGSSSGPGKIKPPSSSASLRGGRAASLILNAVGLDVSDATFIRIAGAVELLSGSWSFQPRSRKSA